jgi:FeS assembly protein IscX
LVAGSVCITATLKNMSDPLNWDASYAIALALRRAHPDADLDAVSLGQIYRWTLALPDFEDDPALANDNILAEIFRDWLEENLQAG